MVHPASVNPQSGTVKTFGFLIMPNFTTIGLASAVETLRMANLAACRPVFRSVLIAAQGAPVTASNGMRVLPDCTLDDAPALDVLLVVGPNPIERGPATGAYLRWLRERANQRLPIGGICTGSYLLAKAGLLDGYRCTIHWEDLPTLRARFPNIICSQQLFELDRDRYTCSQAPAATHAYTLLPGTAVVPRQAVAAARRRASWRRRAGLRLRFGGALFQGVQPTVRCFAFCAAPPGSFAMTARLSLIGR